MTTRSTKHGSFGEVNPATSYTLQEAIDHCGFGLFQYKLTLMAGIILVCEGVGLVVFSLLGPLLECSMHVTSLEQVLIPMIPMLGMALSYSAWGAVSDLYGRRWVVILSTFFVFYFGVLNAFSPNVVWLCIILFIIGIFYGGTYQSATLCFEYTPTKYRLKVVAFFQIIFAVGVIFTYCLAKLIVPNFGLHWFLIFSNTPALLVCLFFFPSMPESARFLLVSNQYNRVGKILETMAKENKSQLPDGYLQDVDKVQALGKLSDLFSPRMRRITILLMVAWLVEGVCYYGVNLIIPTVFVASDGCHGYTDSKDQSTESCSVYCRGLTDEDYNNFIISSLGELTSFLWTVSVTRICNRRRSVLIMFLAAAVTSFISVACLPRLAFSAMMFISRGALNATYNTLLVLNVELFPTIYRSLGVGVNGTVYKLGSLLSPLIGQVLAKTSITYGFVFFGVLELLAGVAVVLIPVETKDRELLDT